MNTSTNIAHLTDDGVAFTVTVDYQQRDCVISRDVLSNLSRSTDENLDLLATYEAYHAKINGVARRIVAAGVQGHTVVLSSQNFT
jgi:hypothetical protein